MKKLLLLTFLALGGSLYAQNSASTCDNAYSLCGALGEPFANTTGLLTTNPASAASYGCLYTYPNPAWFYLPISQSGNFNFRITQASTTGQGLDVDYICWGPFAGPPPICSPENLNSDTQIACSYSVAALETVPIINATEGTYYIILVTNFSNQSGIITIENIDSTDGGPQGALNCSGINLNAFLDNNANGTQDAGEINFPYGDFIYEANQDGIVHNITSFDGDFTIYDQNLSNVYDVSYELPSQYAGYYNVTTSSYSNVAVELTNNIVTYNFPIVPTQTYTDISVNIIPATPLIAGYGCSYYVTYANAGVDVFPSGTVSFTSPAGFEVLGVSQNGVLLPVTYTATGFDYTFSNLQPFEAARILVLVQVPQIPDIALGDLETANVSISPVDSDITPDDNTSSSTQEIVGSYDPNDITESRGREVAINTFDENDYLYYTIRFQNTGTFEARNARIEDMLGTQFDYSTVQVIRSSHDFTMDRQNNHLTWNFNNIHLPASQDNEEASHGYIYFKVKPLPGYQVGDVIPNAADIYFDFNPAVVTNTFETEFVDRALGTKDVIANSFMLYPNPAKNTVHIIAGANNDLIAAVKIYDLAGKTIYMAKANTASLTIDSSAFATGTYFVEVISNANTKTVKKLLID